jgi:hypothetical protein
LENSTKNVEFSTVPTAPTAGDITQSEIQKQESTALTFHVTYADLNLDQSIHFRMASNRTKRQTR